MFFIKNKSLNLLEYKIIPKLLNYLNSERNTSLENIGIEKNGKNAPSALVIYVATAIPYYKLGNISKCKTLNTHALTWHAVELVRQLVDEGYIVDFIDCYQSNPLIKWNKYSLIIDERNNLMNAPKVNNQIRVFYATGLKWDFQNNAEMIRVENFYKRTGYWVNPVRIAAPNFSDYFSDHILFYGNPELMKMFYFKPIRTQLNLSSTFVPSKIIQNISNKREFLWMGSVGAIHKGLDLVVEAFSELDNVSLHIFGFIESDLVFFNWLKSKLMKHSNIIYHGPAKIESEEFQKIVSFCIGHIFPSCSENGAGSVAQTCHFGLIPITTHTANTRSANLGYIIDSQHPENIILEIKEKVQNLLDLSYTELKIKSDSVIEFARTYHTREAYSKSSNLFIKKLKYGNQDI
jgi:hypothetical protein